MLSSPDIPKIKKGADIAIAVPLILHVDKSRKNVAINGTSETMTLGIPACTMKTGAFEKARKRI